MLSICILSGVRSESGMPEHRDISKAPLPRPAPPGTHDGWIDFWKDRLFRREH